MNKVLYLKSILLFHVCYQIQKSSTSYFDSNEQRLDSQSQEDYSEMDEREEHHHNERLKQNQNYNSQKGSSILSYSYNYDECNLCACNKCDNPPDCCKEVCRSCPKTSPQMSQFQIISMPQIPQSSFPMSPESPISMPQILQTPMGQMSLSQMQIPQMQMPQMQMPQLQMPQMSLQPMQISQMPMARRPFPAQFLGQLSNQNLVYLPLSSNIMNFVRNHSVSESPGTKVLNITKTTTTTSTSTTPSTTTLATTTLTNSNVTSLPLAVTLMQNLKQRSKVYLQRQTENKNMLEVALKNILKAFSNNMSKKQTEKLNNPYDKYVLASALRRTKPVMSNVDTSRYEIIPDESENLMLEVRDAKDIRDSV